MGMFGCYGNWDKGCSCFPVQHILCPKLRRNGELPRRCLCCYGNHETRFCGEVGSKKNCSNYSVAVQNAPEIFRDNIRNRESDNTRDVETLITCTTGHLGDMAHCFPLLSSVDDQPQLQLISWHQPHV